MGYCIWVCGIGSDGPVFGEWVDHVLGIAGGVECYINQAGMVCWNWRNSLTWIWFKDCFEMRTKILSIFIALVAKVTAHGYVDNVTVAGVFYEVSTRSFPSDTLKLSLTYHFIGISSQSSLPTPKPPSLILTHPKPYTDPYTSPIPNRIIRPVQGNGPITDLTLIDLQCGGYTAGGIVGSVPANLTAGPVAAGSTVSLRWTLWPTSHCKLFGICIWSDRLLIKWSWTGHYLYGSMSSCWMFLLLTRHCVSSAPYLQHHYHQTTNKSLQTEPSGSKCKPPAASATPASGATLP